MIKKDFHISKPARKKYDIESSFYSLVGNLIVANAQSARYIASKINNVRKSEGAYDQLVTPGEVNALGILHEIFHYVINHYAEKENPGVLKRNIDFLKTELNEEELDKVLLRFIEEFPPLEVYRGIKFPYEYLNGYTDNKPNKELILEELIILHFENSNPAANRLNELFSDKKLRTETSYATLISKSEEFFDREMPTRIGGLHLFKMLRKPIESNPHSLEDQLLYIKDMWGIILDEALLKKLLRGSDLIREDYKLFIKHGGGEKGTPPVPDYQSELERLRRLREQDKDLYLKDVEQFTADIHWMPEVVMMAKNVFVWLHQLSVKYQREINRLDQIPDAELDRLANWNFTALWLIGLWERSSASKKIKQYTGNPEAAASAYSLYDYQIAWELGGEEAFNNLKHRAAERGIRMASDMVPNHTGIFSKWVVERPDYFIQTKYPPYPNYSFNGGNLSEDGRVEVRIEDRYYSREDAAVVFERRDSWTGDKAYIYHGNDGTNMPWNDTAQLNLLNPEVREALIQVIKNVASKTPIIRFDAAMTLTQKHYQRLWFPEPGDGGAIPSRSDYSMTKSEFFQNMPNEFWREVVDRINAEMPSTLLLAEAFWLMEGYFVRTLGMHRVYNSAFMHMMMKEENDKYRKLISNTLEFNPEILKRYVNFMSNPDEETAVNQFGKGDKYFGVAVMMVTLPGLPMFGHGQIEGFSEKYGMEYKKAYYDEHVDDHLVWRHTKEIFPLLKLRYLFSQVYDFELYDFINDYDGTVNENVFAYSNRSGNQTAFVIYNNSYETYEGSIRFAHLKNNNGNVLPRRHIATALDFKRDYKFYYIYTDHRTQLEFLLSGEELNDNGFRIKIFGYQYRICLNFREVYDEAGRYARLHQYLYGRGVASVDEALREMEMTPLHSALEELLSPPNIQRIRSYIFESDKKSKDTNKNNEAQLTDSLTDGFTALVNELEKLGNKIPNPEHGKQNLLDKLDDAKEFYDLWSRYMKRKSVPNWISAADSLLPLNREKADDKAVCVYSVFVTIISSIAIGANERIQNFDRFLLSMPLFKIFRQHTDDEESRMNMQLVKALVRYYDELNSVNVKIKWKKKGEKNSVTKKGRASLNKLPLSELLYDENISSFLNVNEFGGITYFNKERLEKVIDWFYQLMVFRAFSTYKESHLKVREKKEKKTEKASKQSLERSLFTQIKNSYNSAVNIKWLAEEAGYNLPKFTNSLINVNKKSTKNNKDETNEL